MGSYISKAALKGEVILQSPSHSPTIKYASIRQPVVKTEFEVKTLKLGEYAERMEFAWFAVFFDKRPSYVITEAKKYLYKFFFNALKSSYPEFFNNSSSYPGVAEKCLNEAFGSCDDSVFARNVNRKPEGSAYSTVWSRGCSVNVLLISPEKLVFAHLGEVSYFLVRNRKILYRNRFHCLDSKTERNRVESCYNTQIKGRLVVFSEGQLQAQAFATRSIGYYALKRDLTKLRKDRALISKPDVKIFDRHEDDEFIIIENGLLDIMTKEEVVAFIFDFEAKSEVFSVDGCVKSLFEACRERDKARDIMMTLVWLKQ